MSAASSCNTIALKRSAALAAALALWPMGAPEGQERVKSECGKKKKKREGKKKKSAGF